MTFTPEIIPYPDQAALKDTQGQFDSDTPFNVKQAQISMRRHRWYDVQEIGLATGPYALTPGLPAGATQRIQFDNRPDYVIVTCSGDTANTGRVSVFRGESGGPPLRLGPGGYVIFPATTDGVVTILSRGTTPAYGNVIGVAGYDISLKFNPGA
jgi:hypothetical protein